MRTLLAAPSLRPSVAPWRLPALVMLLAIATLSGGIVTLLHQQRSELHEVLYTLAAALLLLTAGIQANIAWRQTPLARRQKQTVRLANCLAIPLRMLAGRLLRQLFSGLVLCYIVALATGPGPTAPYVFAAGAMAWFTVLLLPFTAPPETIDRWRRILHGCGPRRFARFLYIALLVGVVGELSLRASGWLWEPASWPRLNHSTGAWRISNQANRSHPWPMDSRLRPAPRDGRAFAWR